MADLASLSESITSALGAAATGATIARGELTVEVNTADILSVMAQLRDGLEFKILVDLCGNDWPQRAKRFDVVYHLLSLTKNARVRVKAQVGEGESIPSIISVYPAAGWFERRRGAAARVRLLGPCVGDGEHRDLQRIEGQALVDPGHQLSQRARSARSASVGSIQCEPSTPSSRFQNRASVFSRSIR